MSITFSPNVVTAEPREFQLWCCDDCVSPTYASEAQAIAARAALPGFREGAAALPGCPLLREWGDRFSGIPLVVPAGDDFTERPQVSMSTTHAVAVLTVLGYLSDHAPDDVDFDLLDRPLPTSGVPDLSGQATPSELRGRILLAQALTPSDAGRPVTVAGAVVDGGRRVGYLDDMLIRLADLADWSEAHARIIVWS